VAKDQVNDPTLAVEHMEVSEEVNASLAAKYVAASPANLPCMILAGQDEQWNTMLAVALIHAVIGFCARSRARTVQVGEA